ncbi:MAG TPA: SMI1/KNR4 family protein [Tepidisphaeraceae bacterium]|nr:SMI1/KNR4 family protein [Tepidisphaeraceae bacterium]
MAKARVQPPFDWRAWLTSLGDEVEFHDPANAGAIKDAEARLGTAFPDDLRALLLVTNGVTASLGEWLVWPAEQIAEQNVHYRSFADFRELYMPFDHLLFVGERGDGDVVGLPIKAGAVGTEFFRWDHETDGRIWCASGLKDYFKRAVSDQL